MMIGLWCGSLGARSANAALLRVAASRFSERGHEALSVVDVATIPVFDPALVDDPPAAVAELRRQLRTCDAVAVAAPEYAAGVAGSMKNALDWLVGNATIYRKVVGVASAGTTGGIYAVEQLVRTASWQGGWVVATLGVAAPRTKTDDAGAFTDAATLEQIEDWMDNVIDAVEGSVEHRKASVATERCTYIDDQGGPSFSALRWSQLAEHGDLAGLVSGLAGKYKAGSVVEVDCTGVQSPH